MLFVLILLVSSCTIGSQLILKTGVNAIVKVLHSDGPLAGVMAAALSPTVWAALVLQVGGYVLWFFVLAQERVSVAFAISGSFFYLMMAGVSWLVFDERLNLWQWAGLVMISVGVLMLNLMKTP
jgi:drug/metabolite transporter (DMT)-like permease